MHTRMRMHKRWEMPHLASGLSCSAAPCSLSGHCSASRSFVHNTRDPHACSPTTCECCQAASHALCACRHYCKACSNLRQRAYKRHLSLRDLRVAMQAYGHTPPDADFLDFAAQLKASVVQAAQAPLQQLQRTQGGAAEPWHAAGANSNLELDWRPAQRGGGVRQGGSADRGSEPGLVTRSRRQASSAPLAAGTRPNSSVGTLDDSGAAPAARAGAAGQPPLLQFDSTEQMAAEVLATGLTSPQLAPVRCCAHLRSSVLSFTPGTRRRNVELQNMVQSDRFHIAGVNVAGVERCKCSSVRACLLHAACAQASAGLLARCLMRAGHSAARRCCRSRAGRQRAAGMACRHGAPGVQRPAAATEAAPTGLSPCPARTACLGSCGHRHCRSQWPCACASCWAGASEPAWPLAAGAQRLCARQRSRRQRRWRVCRASNAAAAAGDWCAAGSTKCAFARAEAAAHAGHPGGVVAERATTSARCAGGAIHARAARTRADRSCHAEQWSCAPHIWRWQFAAVRSAARCRATTPIATDGYGHCTADSAARTRVTVQLAARGRSA